MNSQREQAIRTCFAKILLQDRQISFDDAMVKATKWYEKKQKEKTTLDDVKRQTKLMHDAQDMGPVTKEEHDRIVFNESFIGPMQRYPKRSLRDIMAL